MTEPLFPFSGVPTFLRSGLVPPGELFDADIAILGAPTDAGSPYLPGSRFGPRAIREHSLRFGDGVGYYDPLSDRSYLVDQVANRRILDLGDADILPTNVVGTFDNITALVRRARQSGVLVVVLGGDHAITYPVVRAFDDIDMLNVFHFDAHLDYAPFIHGLEYTNQHAFRQIRRLGNIGMLAQIGVRSIRNPREMYDDARRDGNRVVTVTEARDGALAGLLNEVDPSDPCYVSIDIDALDISLVPGCVSGEPNGLQYDQLRDMLVDIANLFNIVGLDIVEVNPLLESQIGSTAYVATHLLIEFLGHICASTPWATAHEHR